MIIAEIPETTSYFWKQNRIATYSNWPFKNSDKCNAERMAAAGFYVVEGDGLDSVECFMCGLQLNAWRPNQDPLSRHKKFWLTCPFTKLTKQDEDKWTMKELLYLCEQYGIKVDTDTVKKDLAKLKGDREQLPKNPLRLTLKNKKYRMKSFLYDSIFI